MDTHIYSSEFKEKIKYISSLNNENCKFLYNAYTKLTSGSNINVTDYLYKNGCTLSDSVESITAYCLGNNSVVFELSKNNEDTQKFHDLYDQNNITHLAIMSLSAKDIQNMLDTKPNLNVFLNIDISLFEPWYNWDIQLEQNVMNMLDKLDKIPLNELKINTEEKVNLIVKSKYNENTKHNGLNVTAFTKKLHLLLNSTNYKCNLFTNIYDSTNSINTYYILELSELIKCVAIKSNREKHQYIYDTLCKKLEMNIEKYNYCLFEKNMCIAQRAKCEWPKATANGCCFDVTKNAECEHLNCKSCDITCISCRLFTCRYLKDRGIDFDIRKNILAKTYFNLLQMPELIWNFFTEKEVILKKVEKFSLKK